MLPNEAFQVTDLSEVVPWTFAINGRVPVTIEKPEEGEILTEVTVGLGTGAAVTVTETEADLVGSATLVAVTVAVPAVAGAVNAPEDVMLPNEAVHVTELFVVLP